MIYQLLGRTSLSLYQQFRLLEGLLIE
jgi:hypothetical protein